MGINKVDLEMIHNKNIQDIIQSNFECTSSLSTTRNANNRVLSQRDKTQESTESIPKAQLSSLFNNNVQTRDLSEDEKK